MLTWSDDLHLANELARRTGDEASQRWAISRAYYAAFGSAGDYLNGSGSRVPTAGRAHTVVWDRFHALPNPVHRRIADLGRNLRRRSGRADYDLDFPQFSAAAR